MLTLMPWGNRNKPNPRAVIGRPGQRLIKINTNFKKLMKQRIDSLEK